jgi:hypothetical protein
VRATAQLQITGRRRAAVREGDDVVIFEEAAFGAAAALSHECTLAAVARPDLALDGSWNAEKLSSTISGKYRE